LILNDNTTDGEWEAVCDECGDELWSGAVSMTEEEFRQHMVREGWMVQKLSHGDEFNFCPVCKANL
jgi:hypothetical protein